ncbi:hypothetical protein BJY04DRAFT_221287 [Aspergillus karnatakaensis]|uniref:uncharacterized protein n=1 Tax=Aspergillus karnatakaensis TaxID=1810916 RepID=UPI003CCD2176
MSEEHTFSEEDTMFEGDTISEGETIPKGHTIHITPFVFNPPLYPHHAPEKLWLVALTTPINTTTYHHIFPEGSRLTKYTAPAFRERATTALVNESGITPIEVATVPDALGMQLLEWLNESMVDSRIGGEGIEWPVVFFEGLMERELIDWFVEGAVEEVLDEGNREKVDLPRQVLISFMHSVSPDVMSSGGI